MLLPLVVGQLLVVFRLVHLKRLAASISKVGHSTGSYIIARIVVSEVVLRRYCEERLLGSRHGVYLRLEAGAFSVVAEFDLLVGPVDDQVEPEFSGQKRSYLDGIEYV